MNNKAVQTAVEENVDELNDFVIDAIRDIKGKNIVKLDLTDIEDTATDYFIIAEGESTTQVNAIAANIRKRLKEEKDYRNIHMTGTSESKWVLIDLFDTIVHIFHPETRAYYELEDLWSDARFTEYQDI